VWRSKHLCSNGRLAPKFMVGYVRDLITFINNLSCSGYISNVVSNWGLYDSVTTVVAWRLRQPVILRAGQQNDILELQAVGVFSLQSLS
jgi:hypothetical protein